MTLRQRWAARQERPRRERNPAAAEMRDILDKVIERGPDARGYAQPTREEVIMLKALSKALR